MARIRTIKPEMWEDEKISEIPIPARLLFIGTWNFADDFGVITDSVKIDERQKFLKTVPIQGMKLVDDDGEVIMLYPPSKTSTSSYKITLAK